MSVAGYLPSSFDLLNVEHLDAIAQARTHCERLTVGVFSDEWVDRADGRPPVVPLEERVALLRHVRGVDEVVVHDDVDISALGSDCVLFSLTGGDVGHVDDLGTVISIDPRRHTESRILLQALRPDEQSAVA